MRLALAGIGVLLVAGGCVSAPSRRAPRLDPPIPDRWSAPVDRPGEIEIDWWSELGDERLGELIDLALERNHDLHAAAARLDRARAEARIAGADLKPSVSAGLGAARQRQNFVGFPIPGSDSVLSTTSTRYGVSLDTTWEVDLWGRLRAGARASLAEAQASEADLAAARLSLAGQTAKLWFAVVESAQQLALARRSTDSFRAAADQVRSRFERGLRPAVELRLALSNLSAAEALRERRQQELDGRIRQLEVLLGEYPTGRLLERFPALELPSLRGEVPAGLPAGIVARRPDLIAAERRLAARDQRWLQARRSLYPRLSLTGGGGTASDQLGDLLDGDFRVWSLVANLLQPVYQGGRLRAGVDRADALRNESLSLYAGAVLNALREVETSLVAEGYLSNREHHVAETAEHLVAARRLAERRYREGLGDYLTVLESQSRALVAESDLIQLRRARLDGRIDLILSLGGGFAASPLASPGPGSGPEPDEEEPS